MTIITTIKKCLILAVMVALIAACASSADEELSHYINEVKIRSAKPIEPIPVFIPLEKFIYPEQDNRRSPFKQKEVIKAVDPFAPDTKRIKQALEQFPLDALKFVGVLKQGTVVWALISQPNGDVTRVKIGDYMGQNFGRVIRINDTTLKLEETIQVAGKWERKITTFNLNASD